MVLDGIVIVMVADLEGVQVMAEDPVPAQALAVRVDTVGQVVGLVRVGPVIAAEEVDTAVLMAVVSQARIHLGQQGLKVQ